MLARTVSGNSRLAAALEAVPQRPERQGRLINELERERGRIARELHAGAGQPLAGIKLNLDLLESWSDSLPAGVVPAEVKDTLRRLHQLTETALGQLRAVSHRLHPPDWQELTTEAALRALVSQSGLPSTCDITLDIPPLAPEPAHAVKVTLYRCAQECISNVVRHSGASRFHLRLTSLNGWIELRICDNGGGFGVGEAAGQGIGLTALREHAEALGGIVHISSSLQGTAITIGVPSAED
jgi:signal transduction histidine kinase